MKPNHTHEPFIALYGHEPEATVFSPGRVNLIGEHTDYSGGYVLPMALSLGIKGMYRERDDDRILAYSAAYASKGTLEISPKNLAYKKGFSFGNYIQGALDVLKKEGYQIQKGFELHIESTLPPSAGLSSSAALEMLVLSIIRKVNALDIDDTKLVRMARKIENDYMGVSSGIMDQYAVAFSKKDHALFLDTATLKSADVPIDMRKYRLVMMNTNKKRNLEDSDYNERFESVAAGERILTASKEHSHLGGVSLDTFENEKHRIDDPVIERRVRHVINENARTCDAREALEKRDYLQFGKLMNASHESLKADFEVSCDELDFLVEQNLALGAIGSRMTGAGFGGTMIALYRKEDVPTTFETLKNAYQKRFNKPLDIYIASSASGVLAGEGIS